jgi:carbon storage regulator
MLVLTRKAGQKVIIDGKITVTLLYCEGGRVRLGIDAPAEMKVLRSELLERQEVAPAERA